MKHRREDQNVAKSRSARFRAFNEFSPPRYTKGYTDVMANCSFDEQTNTSDIVIFEACTLTTPHTVIIKLANAPGVRFALTDPEDLELFSTGLALAFVIGPDFEGSLVVTQDIPSPEGATAVYSIAVTVGQADARLKLSWDPKIKVIPPTPIR